MLFALIFMWNRMVQIVTLIPAVGMLGWFVNKFSSANVLTPDSILILFIVTVLALSWAVLTLFAYHRSSHNALFVAFVDVLIIGALIAGIYFLRAIQWSDCTSPSQSEIWYNQVTGVGIPGYAWEIKKPCAMLKASWAFAIMNTIFFAVTAFAAWSHGDSAVVYDERVVRSRRSGYHSDRHSHRHSRSRSGGSHRSHHSHRRVYV